MSIQINDIPHQILKIQNAQKAVIITTEHLGDQVMISTSLDPEDLHAMSQLEELAVQRKEEGVYSITLTILKLDSAQIAESTSYFENRYRLISELDTLLAYNKDVYVVYVITHYNPQQKPLGPLTINIGGDCYREDRSIKDLQSILNRTRGLAEAMLKKAVMIFPDIPALHGGKKGEWIILDRKGKKIEGLSAEAIVALGSVIIPKGIRFLNRFKERQAIEMGILDHFPATHYIRPDTGSPDVLSGVFWRGGKKEKYLNMCDAWHQRSIDLANFTCIPEVLGGTLDESARPTGYGVATTAVQLSKRYFHQKEFRKLKFLLEAAGNVGTNTIEALLNIYHVPPRNITVFDRRDTACTFVEEKYGVNTVVLAHHDFYQTRLPRDVANGSHFDVWVNNGEGDNTRALDIQNLLAAGVKVFCGGANNLLKVSEEADCKQLIFDAGGWAWPDPAASGGGWTLAVFDLFTRCQGQPSNTPQIQEQILDVIISRNTKLIQDVLGSFNYLPQGHELWQKVNDIINQRVQKTLGLDIKPSEIFKQANVETWNLP